jgi:hypothetical protein
MIFPQNVLAEARRLYTYKVDDSALSPEELKFESLCIALVDAVNYELSKINRKLEDR